MDKSYFRGWPIVYIEDKWVYEDNKEPIPSYGGKERPCKKCNKIAVSDFDPCLGLLPGVKHACCGHGIKNEAYIIFNNGKTIYDFKMGESV